MQTVFEMGALNYFDAVSCHPYRSGGPESVLAEYANLTSLINQYAPQGKYIPILSGEWGWTTCSNCSTSPYATVDDQAKFLARQWLINAYAGVPISIFYDYKNDGTNMTYTEDNFGTVQNPYNSTAFPHVPKPSFNAAQTVQNILGHLAFDSRIDAYVLQDNGTSVVDNQTYVLSFANYTYAIWKASAEYSGTCDPSNRIDCGHSGTSESECNASNCCFEYPYVGPGPQCYFRPITNFTGSVSFLALNSGCYEVINIYGTTLTSICTDKNGMIQLVADDAPVYLTMIGTTSSSQASNTGSASSSSQTSNTGTKTSSSTSAGSSTKYTNVTSEKSESYSIGKKIAILLTLINVII